MKRIYIPRKPDDIPEDVKQELNFDDGFYLIDTPDNRFKFKDFLPYGFLEDRSSLKIDLIPKNSWGASLANSLTKDTWDSIRKPFIHCHGNRCSLCGNKGVSLNKTIQDVDTHELWEYSSLSSKKKVQKLVGFLSVCSSCHLMFHLGFSKTIDKFDITKKRLQKLEQLNDNQIDARINNIFSIWSKRSEYDWVMDISILKKHGIEDIKFKPKVDKSKFIL